MDLISMALFTPFALDYRKFLPIFILISLLTITPTVSYNTTVTVEAPFVQQSTAGLDIRGVETFDQIAVGTYATLTTNFGMGANSAIKGTYYNLHVINRDTFGGAGGTGHYPSCPQGQKYGVKLSQQGQPGVKYFGAWLSALDPGNLLEFLFQGKIVSSWSSRDLLQLLPPNNTNYFGNPTYNPRAFNQQAFAFYNFFFSGGQIDEVRFTQNQEGIYESDNHSVGVPTILSVASTSSTSPTPVSGQTTLPETPFPVAAVAGAAAGGLTFILIAGIVAFRYRRKDSPDRRISGDFESDRVTHDSETAREFKILPGEHAFA